MITMYPTLDLYANTLPGEDVFFQKIQESDGLQSTNAGIFLLAV
jgi:hypothetical protein